MKRKKKKPLRQPKKLSNNELHRFAKIIVKQLPHKKIEYTSKSFYCPLCVEIYCYRTDGKQIHCKDCHYGTCEKKEYIPKTCNQCKEEL